MIELRDYQKKQISFIEERIDLTDTIGIQSPTGSGKTFTILEYAKMWLEKPENHLSNVVITTGFNNLVFLLEKRAKEFGLNNTKILIGTKACNCPKCMEEAGLKEFKVFTEEDYSCGDKHKKFDTSTNIFKNKVCPFTRELYLNHLQDITNNTGQIILMNHSSFLVHQCNLKNVSLVIVDEAHTFNTFYDSFIRLELDKDDLTIVDKAINSLESPMDMIIKMNMSNNVQLPQMQIDKLCEKILDDDIRSRTKEFFETVPSPQNYIETTEDSFTVDKFYRMFEFEIRPKFLLFSATLDKYTRLMFNCKDSYFYREIKTFCDYSKSEFIAIPGEFNDSFQRFIKYVDSKGFTSGLCLSTTIYDVNQALNYDGILGFKMFKADELHKFEEYKDKKILVGSRRLFQGIDIQNIQFVCLNKLPFPNWNEKTQAMKNYVTNNGKNNIDFWRDYSVPKTENDIVQSTGRLWRNIDSYGVISIFDERIIKHKYMIRHTMKEHRYGINMNIMLEDDSVIEFDIKKLDEIDNRKDISEDNSLKIED